MQDINWAVFSSKFYQKENTVFESLAYMLFCYEHNIRIGIFRFKNQTGIETEPIMVEGIETGFQAKYYDTKLAENKDDIISSIKKAKSKNPGLAKIIIYTNKEFSESSDKTKKKPAYLIEIEKIASSLNLQLEWRGPSHLEKQLSVPENNYLAEYFFSSGHSIISFLEKFKAHTESILLPIQSEIQFKEKQIKIDRAVALETIYNNDKQVIILAGEGGSGKTAIIKDLYFSGSRPCYVLKAAEFNRVGSGSVFSDFGQFGLEDFITAHEVEENKVFIIDSAEKLADLTEQEVFIEFLSALIKGKWKIIFTTRNSYLEDLSFQMLQVYRQPFDIIRVNDLTAKELLQLSVDFDFKLPDEERLSKLLCNLFYLGEYLSNYGEINTGTGYTKFRDILWQKRIQSKSRKGNVRMERENCFLGLVRARCATGLFFLKGEGCSGEVLALLEQDEIIKFDALQGGYFITHDIYEEWALGIIIERAFTGMGSYGDFFEKIGHSLPVRRAFRSWLSDKIALSQEDVMRFIEQVFTDKSVPSFWTDELLVSVLLSVYSRSFFSMFEKSLLADEKFYLKKIIFLLRTACKEVDTELNKALRERGNTSLSPSLVFTKPKGTGWEVVIEFLFTNISLVQKEELEIMLPLLKEWTEKQKYGAVTKTAGLFALHFYRDAETNESAHYPGKSETLLLEIVMNAAKELKTELVEIIDGLLVEPYKRHAHFDSLREKILASPNDSLAVTLNLPTSVIKLARISWYLQPGTRHPMDSGIGVEGYYSIRSQWHHDYFPASALQTPVYYLLIIDLPAAVNFILEFTNLTIEAYFKSGFDESVREIDVSIGDHKTKQYSSPGLWSMYRGSGSPVTPYLLQSIHMALEKYLLEIAKSVDNKIMKGWLIYLLKNTRSVSITGVVCSIILANPDEFFEVALLLFNNYDFFKNDNVRQGQESQAERLYSIGRGLDNRSKIYDEERMATCKDKHRKLSLEHLALQYQYYKPDSLSESDFKKRQEAIWKIIDEMHAAIDLAASETNHNKNVRLLLARMDRRKMKPVVTKQDDDTTMIAFNPQLEPDLKQYSEEGMKQYNEKFKYTGLKLWATGIIDEGKGITSGAEFNDRQDLALAGAREIWEQMANSSEEFNLFNRDTPGYVCSALLRKYSTQLSAEDLLFCMEIVIAYAASPLQEGYGYQIADGVEAAVGTLPYLYALYPERKDEFSFILMALLFNTYPLGEYKRICDYSIEAINNTLYNFDAEAADKILSVYLQFKGYYDKGYSIRTKENYKKSWVQLLNEFLEKYEKKLNKAFSVPASIEKIKLDKLSVRILETVFLTIPVSTTDPGHLLIVKNLLEKYARQLLAESKYNDEKTEFDYRLKSRFGKKMAAFLLNRENATIAGWAKPLVEAFNASTEMGNFFSDLILLEDRIHTYDKFWIVWGCFYGAIKKMALGEYRHRSFEVMTNYLLAWRWWGSEQKNWHSLRDREKVFFSRVSVEMGSNTVVFYAISKLLNDIGSGFLDEGIIWLSQMLANNHNLHEDELTTNTVYYIELLTRKYVYLNRSKLKVNLLMKGHILVLLDFLVSKGSVNGYLLREDIL